MSLRISLRENGIYHKNKKIRHNGTVRGHGGTKTEWTLKKVRDMSLSPRLKKRVLMSIHEGEGRNFSFEVGEEAGPTPTAGSLKKGRGLFTGPQIRGQSGDSLKSPLKNQINSISKNGPSGL